MDKLQQHWQASDKRNDFSCFEYGGRGEQLSEVIIGGVVPMSLSTKFERERDARRAYQQHFINHHR